MEVRDSVIAISGGKHLKCFRVSFQAFWHWKFGD